MDFAKQTYELGWMPDADEVNGPPNCLLRADNLVLDELGVAALRQGSSKINSSALGDTDVHSLFTVVRSGTRLRYAGAGDDVYCNSSSILSSINGSNDIFFGSHMGQTLIARGTTKKKHDGTTVRNLGIAMTGGAPTVQAALAPNTKQFATWALGETADHVMVENDGTGLTYNQDHDGTANGAVVLKANATTLKGILQRAFGSNQDFSQFTGPVAGADPDVLSTWVYVANNDVVLMVVLFIDVNDGSYQLDYFYKQWLIGGTRIPGSAEPGIGEPDPNDPGSDPSDPPLI